MAGKIPFVALSAAVHSSVKQCSTYTNTFTGDEPRRSGRSNKGHHKRSASPTPVAAPDAKDVKPVKPTEKKSRKGAAELGSADEQEGAEVIRCICGDDNPKDKRAFIGCDACSVWQHNVCMGMPDDDDDVGEHYFCEECRPEEHQETLQALAKGEKIWETRNKLYTAWKKSKARKSKGGNETLPWLRHELQEANETVEASEPPLVNDSGNKRKRAVKEEAEEPAAKPSRTARQEKRQKSVAKTSPDYESGIVPIDELPADRKKIAQALAKLLAADLQARVKSGELKSTDEPTLADGYASQIEYALYANHGGPSSTAYGTQFRALNANLKKNRTLITELLAGRLTADELSIMSSSDMASEELQKERAAIKAEADRQITIEQVEQGPRYRRTHKGDEIVENEAAASSSAPVARPVRQNTSDAEIAGLEAKSPTAATPTAVSDHKDEERRTSSSNFDMQNIWAKTGQSVPRPLQMPARRRSSMQPGQDDGTKEDADIDRLLNADDDETYSPQEYPGDIVWRGKIVSTTGDAAPVVNARWVSGRDVSQSMPWRELLPDKLNIDGRLAVGRAEEYLCGLQWSSSSDVSVLALTPFDDAAAFNTVFDYFKSRERYAVVNKDKPSALLVKDLYIIPVEVGGKIPDHVGLLEHNTIKQPIEERLLLATFVIARSAEHLPAATAPDAAQTQATNGHRHRISSNHGPAASPINASGPTFSTSRNPDQSSHHPAQSPVASAAHQPALYAQTALSQEDVMKLGVEILGPFFYAPVAQQVLAVPGITRDQVHNMRKIFEMDPSTQNDLGALAAKLGFNNA